ncbi:similar to An11g04830 [Aspergillus luchuensis]|uniref:Similar to An11g04830 n=1 Tax=Aspergillus kawachii TaxID=1069201 RepID=A0A146FZU4_ASPKA|nr:similar to An11g04830 [Aspergillus luchuensis]
MPQSRLQRGLKIVEEWINIPQAGRFRPLDFPFRNPWGGSSKSHDTGKSPSWICYQQE